MQRGFRWSGLLLAMALASCVSNAEQGDKAAAVGDWKAAVESYRLALQTENASADLRRKYTYAVGQAIAQALAVARRCESAPVLECVQQETSYVLTLDPANAEATQIRAAAESRVAKRLLAEARDNARLGKYQDAYEAIARSTNATSDAAITAEAATLRAEIAPGAAAYAEALMREAEAGPPALKLERLGECVSILESVVLDVSDKAEVLAQARARQKALAAEQQQQVQIEREAQVAEQRERNQKRTVSVTGALIGLGKADGTQWDGMGDKVTSEASNALAKAMTAAGRPDVAAAAVLAGAAAGALQKPDIQGRAELWVNGQLAGEVDLAKQQDTFTPQWSTVRWEKVDIEATRIRIELKDADLSKPDNVGIAELNAEDLKAAAASGHVHAVRVDDQTSGQVLFLLVSVM